MKCPELQAFEEYLDGDLTAAERRDFEEHLRACSSCQKILETEHRFEALLRSQSVMKAPAGFKERVLQRLETIEKPSLLPDWLLALALGLAVMFAGVMIGKWGNVLFQGLLEKIGRLDFSLNLLGGWEKIAPMTQTDWYSQLTSGGHLILLNFVIAGIIFCWGLWQMVKVLR